MSAQRDALHALFDATTVLCLGVLSDGAPAVSLVPYVLKRAPVRFYILVSELSPHTRALRGDARCGWMVNESPREVDASHALVRVMGRAEARFLTRDEAREVGAEGLYAARFPIAETLLKLKDFHFCELVPTAGTVSFVQGFGRAYSVKGDDLDTFEHNRGG